ncbi:BTB/POZ domain-containing protein 1-like isoform X2 [Zootermopsis nevadensis]|uniref:BTB/POZ domain-containing protein 2 n=1 Tax=Zootermopsis nevadensis TaxID=136037 RepID=A0A067QZ20_ZOONE|nr:BTB/POZ domain-containing protein 1-like isoform X2 [Zootermopsis nevadensis]KDR10233.1 BTB/POZ domain-containing protein 2 [Zootermopsis nevadensis]
MATGISANEVCNSTVSRLSNIRLEENAQNQNAGQFLSVDTVPQNMLPSNAPNNHQSHIYSSGMEREGMSGSTSYPHSSRRQCSNSSAGSSSASTSQSCSSTQSIHSDSHPVYNWQATKPTVKERFAFMFNNEILCDVHFIVGRDIQQQRIPAHKFVLSVGSAVFDAMFNGTLATKADETELPDVEPAAFLALLRFLYSDEVQIGPETVMTTLYTAKKYAVPALEKHCVDFLKSNLGSDNAFMLLTQARLFDEPQLAALCLEMIDKNTTDALAADGFTDIDLDTLNAVLERDTLRIREAKLFQAVVRWSEAECSRQQLPATPDNKRSVLGRALSLVRFPLMSVEEFAVGAAQSGLLSDREVVSLFLYFTVNPKPAVSFLEVPRCCMTGKEQTVNRFQQIENRWGYSGTSDRIRFLVDRRIFVVGFGLYGSIHGPTEYHVNLQVIHTSSGKVCGSNNTSFSCDGSNYTFRVMFKEPVEIHPNTSYTASATLKGPDSHYGTKGLRKVTLDCPSIGKVTFQFSYAAGNNNGTSVEDGQIPEIIFYT